MCSSTFSHCCIPHFLAVRTDEGQSPHIWCFVPRIWGDMASTNRPCPGATEHECCFPGLSREKRDSFTPNFVMTSQRQ